MWTSSCARALWQFVRRLNGSGHTVVLTTHYLDEAEALCGRIAMMKQGRIVALDTTRNLLNSISGHTLRVRLEPESILDGPLAAHARREADGYMAFDLLNCDEVETILNGVRTAGRTIVDIEIAKPDLEQVFVQIMQRP